MADLEVPSVYKRNASSDPFLSAEELEVAELTLSVGTNAALTLGRDSLVVLDDDLPAKRTFDCFGLISTPSTRIRTIPYFNVLHAELSEFSIAIQYTRSVSKSVVRPCSIVYSIDKVDGTLARSWTSRLLEQAYGASQRRKRIKVLVNPHGGTGLAQRLFARDIEPIFRAARCELDVEVTKYSGHAIEIAEKLDTDQWDVVACCSGDGLPHEVFNGLARQSHPIAALSKVAVVQLPCGSGNAMSLNLNGTDSPSLAALTVVKGVRMPLDLVSITQGDRRKLSFLSQSIGMLADSDLGTENLRWMGGIRFQVGFLVRLLHKTVYPCDVAVCLVNGDKAAIKEAYQREVAIDPPKTSNLAGSRSQTTFSSIDPIVASNSLRDSITESSTPSSTPRDFISAVGGPSKATILPHLQFGTVTSPLPSGWTMSSHNDLGNLYAGNMSHVAAATKIFPMALPSDGCLDLVTYSGLVSRLKVLSTMGSIADGSYVDMAHIRYQKVSAYRVIPKPQRAGQKGYISIDGESFPYEPFQAEVHKGLGTVLSKNGRLFET